MINPGTEIPLTKFKGYPALVCCILYASYCIDSYSMIHTAFKTFLVTCLYKENLKYCCQFILTKLSLNEKR